MSDHDQMHMLAEAIEKIAEGALQLTEVVQQLEKRVTLIEKRESRSLYEQVFGR